MPRAPWCSLINKEEIVVLPGQEISVPFPSDSESSDFYGWHGKTFPDLIIPTVSGFGHIWWKLGWKASQGPKGEEYKYRIKLVRDYHGKNPDSTGAVHEPPVPDTQHHANGWMGSINAGQSWALVVSHTSDTKQVIYLAEFKLKVDMD